MLRAAAAALAAALVVGAAWIVVPHGLPRSTDIAGYPTFADFPLNRNFHAYYLIVLVFPLLTVAFTIAAGRLGPGRTARSTLRPVRLEERAAASSAGGIGVGGALGVLLRLAAPAAAVALTVNVAVRTSSPALSDPALLAGLAWAMAVPALGGLAALIDLRRRPPAARPPGPVLRLWLARASALSLAAMPLLLIPVSRSTETLAVGGGVTAHHWLPAWVPVLATLGWAGCAARALRRASPASGGLPAAIRIERAGVLALAVPLVFFLTFAFLPGSLSFFEGYDDAQNIAAPHLVFSGAFPWTELYTIHGLLPDVFQGQIGLSLFGDSRWAVAAGVHLLVAPLSWLVLYAFAVRFGGAPLGLALLAAAALGGFRPLSDRFVFMPLLLLLLAAVLERPSWSRCALLMTLLTVGAIVTPESALMAAGLLATLVAADLLRRAPGEPWRRALVATRRCALVGLALTGAWAAFLLVTGSLGAFIDYYLIFGPGHSLAGAIPRNFSLVREPRVAAEFLGPPALVILTIWRSAFLLVRRRPWATTDVLMVTAASWVAAYFPKALGRLDSPHVDQVMTVAWPLALLWLALLASSAQVGAGRLAARLTAGVVAAGPRVPGAVPRALHVGAAAVAFLPLLAAAVLATLPLGDVTANGGRFRPAVNEPAIPRLGYTSPGAVAEDAIRDLGTVLATYAPPGEPVFDFTNSPGIVYYLLDRSPGTRFFHVSMAIPTAVQRDVIDDLERSRPRAVVYNSAPVGNIAAFGLPAWDGLSNSVRHRDIAEYLLDRYSPLVSVGGFLVMLRDDLVASAPPLPPLRSPPRTTDLYAQSGSCDWGTLPSFLEHPADLPARDAVVATLRTHADGTPLVVSDGWALSTGGGMASEVLAVAGDAIVGRATPGSPRTDITQRVPGAPLTTGWSLTVPVATPDDVTFYAHNGDGTVSVLRRPGSAPGKPPPATEVTTEDGVRHRVVANPIAGYVDHSRAALPPGGAVVLPAGTRLGDYAWLEVEGAGDLGGASLRLTDSVDSTPHDVRFRLVPGRGNTAYVQVGSCGAWRALDPARLTLVRAAGPTITGLRLIR